MTTPDHATLALMALRERIEAREQDGHSRGALLDHLDARIAELRTKDAPEPTDEDDE
jgi:hypothetical protein